MSLRASARTILRFEPLELRTVPASGNVEVKPAGNEWLINGDDLPNTVTLALHTNGMLRVSGGSGTTVNRGAYADIPLTKPVSISLKGGDDRLTINGTAAKPIRLAGALSVNMGTGVDVVQAYHLFTGRAASFDMGVESTKNGRESVDLISVDVAGLNYTSARTLGSNALGMSNSTVRGDTSIKVTLPGATNFINLASNKFYGSISASLSHEPNTANQVDSFNLTFSTVTGRIGVNTGDGRSQVKLFDVTAGTIDISGGSGYDQVLVNKVTARQARFDGGGGSEDRISGSGNTFGTKPTVRSFEVNQLK